MNPPACSRLAHLFASVALALLLAACGGADGDTPVAAAPPASAPPVQVPAGPGAAFVAAASAAAFAPVAFDATASTSGDGSALTYVWNFGDGQRGGGAKIAHAFASAGMPTVTLTVIDAAGRQATRSQGVTVTAAAAAARVTVHVAVVDGDGAALGGVAVASPGVAAALGTTDATGKVDVALDTGRPLVLRFTRSGYADQFLAVELPARAGTDTRLNAVLRPRDAAQSLADATVGGTLTARAGATITLPASALVDGAGAAVSGAVDIAMTAVDPTLPGGGGFPGRFDGIRADGSTTPIVSLGTVEFALSAGGQRLQLAAGKTATIEIPIQAARRLDGSVVVAGDTTPLWSLDETTAIWIEEGTGTVVANAGSPSGLALRAVVSHFSWWNTDLGFDPYGPNPRCIADGDIGIPEAIDAFNAATVCNMLAEIDRNLGGQSTGRVSAQAAPSAALPPAVVGFSRSVVLPIAGGVRVAVPANIGVALKATALNGTWAGQLVVNGPVGREEEVLVKLRPLAVSGATVEPLALPVDVSRVVSPTRVARFSFVGSAAQFAHFQIGAATGSVVAGNIRVLQGATVIGSSSFGVNGADLLVALPAAGGYFLEIEETGLAGTVRIRGELLGGYQDETVSFPADVTRSVAPYVIYRAGFDVAVPTGAHIAYRLTSNRAVELRLLAPDGSVLWSKSGAFDGLVDLVLPVAGRYVFTSVALDGTASSFRITSEPIDWVPLGTNATVDDGYSVIDLVGDRNGNPVEGFARRPVVGQQRAQVLQLRRWNGTAFEDLGGPITIDHPCGAVMASFAFDAGNVPTIVYASSSSAGGFFVTARRLVAGVWQGIGPNDGVLPNSSPGSNGLCDSRYTPRLAIDTIGRPIVAYKADDAGLRVQRFDAGAWGKLAPSADDLFPGVFGSFDVQVDPAGTPWVVQGSDGPTRVKRLDAATGTWLAAGANGGLLPESGTAGFSVMRLQFDAAGRAVIGGLIGVGVDTYSTGTAVYRLDGATWSTTGGYLLPDSYVNNTLVPGFALLGNDALMAWQNQNRQTGAAAFVVQRNTPAGWSAFGSAADGSLPQYLAHGITPVRTTLDQRLLVVGNVTYLLSTVNTSNGSSPFIEVVLHRYMGR